MRGWLRQGTRGGWRRAWTSDGGRWWWRGGGTTWPLSPSTTLGPALLHEERCYIRSWWWWCCVEKERNESICIVKLNFSPQKILLSRYIVELVKFFLWWCYGRRRRNVYEKWSWSWKLPPFVMHLLLLYSRDYNRSRTLDPLRHLFLTIMPCAASLDEVKRRRKSRTHTEMLFTAQ